MTPSRFPKRITIDLATFHQDGLRQLAGLLPHQDPDELLKVVISRGLVEMLTSEFGCYHPDLSARAGNRVYPRPGVLYRERQKELREQAEAEDHQAQHEAQRRREDLGLAEFPFRGSHPATVADSLPDDTRARLDAFLEAHPEFDEEDALAVLVRRGLDHTEELEDVVQSAREKSASRILNLAERLYARSKRRCAM